jgi:hypothetical protein
MMKVLDPSLNVLINSIVSGLGTSASTMDSSQAAHKLPKSATRVNLRLLSTKQWTEPPLTTKNQRLQCGFQPSSTQIAQKRNSGKSTSPFHQAEDRTPFNHLKLKSFSFNVKPTHKTHLHQSTPKNNAPHAYTRQRECRT